MDYFRDCFVWNCFFWTWIYFYGLFGTGLFLLDYFLQTLNSVDDVFPKRDFFNSLFFVSAYEV